MSASKRNMPMTLFRYGVVGFCTNAVGYFFYLGVTWLGFGPKSAMSILYVIGATMGFIGNRRWVFGHDGRMLTSVVRYWVAHTIGYWVNFALLYGLVDVLGYPHRYVQAGAILVVAGCLFLMFHFFVFPRAIARRATA